MGNAHSGITAVLEQRAQADPDRVAFTFVDYDVDPNGFEESLTYAQLLQRVRVMAHELLQSAAPGDRVAILAPQSLEYVFGVLGAIYAGLVAVPLPVPMIGVHDERVTGVLNDCAPIAIVTTSAAVDAIMPSLAGVPGAPRVIEADALDYDTPPPPFQVQRSRADVAFLQYTSGSTRTPAGVVVTNDGLSENMAQIKADYFENNGGEPPVGTTLVSWLPFYHDMGLMLGIFGPISYNFPAVLTSPMSFLAKPARWMQLVAKNTKTVSPAPNFAYELAVRRTSDADMEGLTLSDVLSLVTGAERIHAATLRRFNERFASLGLPDTALRSAYGLAEATVYCASAMPGVPLGTARFNYDDLAAGVATPDDEGVELISHGPSRACLFKIVDPDICTENAEGKVGEVWVHGDNVSSGYWQNPTQTAKAFGHRLVDPAAGTPEEDWLRTGDLGVMYGGELYIIGRIKDLLIVDGKNHYPDDIEATIQEITGGRVAAVSVQDDRSERLVTVIEMKKRGTSDEEVESRLATVAREVASAVSRSHGLRIADIVMVSPGSIPITTSGKIRRQECGVIYRREGFSRLITTA